MRTAEIPVSAASSRSSLSFSNSARSRAGTTRRRAKFPSGFAGVQTRATKGGVTPMTGRPQCTPGLPL
jgi:hypothetical protein